MTDEGCTRASRRHSARIAWPTPAPHKVPPRVTAKARAVFAWRIIELRLDEILADTESPTPR